MGNDLEAKQLESFAMVGGWMDRMRTRGDAAAADDDVIVV